MAEKKVCSLWEKNWSNSMPDAIVKKAIGHGVIDPECLPPDRVKRIELLP